VGEQTFPEEGRVEGQSLGPLVVALEKAEVAEMDLECLILGSMGIVALCTLS